MMESSRRGSQGEPSVDVWLDALGVGIVIIARCVCSHFASYNDKEEVVELENQSVMEVCCIMSALWVIILMPLLHSSI